MNKISLILALLVVSLHVNAQESFSAEQIDNLYKKTISDTSSLIKKIVSEEHLGIINYFYKDTSLQLITFYRCNCGETSIDDYLHEELLFFDNKLVSIRILLRWDEFDKGYSDESKSKVEEQIVYLDSKGNCLKYYQPRKAEGNRITVLKNLEKQPLIDEDCMFCPYDGTYGDEYLEKLKSE